MNVKDNENLAALLAECYDDPDLFNSAVLQRAPYWIGQDGHKGQYEWCQSLVKHKTLSIETGNMLGKDYWVGGIVMWWLWTRPNSLVFVTGPGQTSIGSVTWKEIRRAVEGCPFWPDPLKARVTTGIKTSPHLVEVEPGWQALGFSTTTIERMSGQHAGQLLVIVEEASGVEDHAWEAIHSLGATKLVAIGNPLKPDGGFVNLCNAAATDIKEGVPEAESACHINTPSTASPHANLVSSPVGLASRGWMDQQFRLWGGQRALYCQVHIFAKRPAISAAQLIDPTWLDWATQYHRPGAPPNHAIHKTRRLAIDLGEGVGRDCTALLVRDDWGILDITAGNALGLSEAAHEAARLQRKWNIPDHRISYDAAGIGRDFKNHLIRVGLPGALPYFGSSPCPRKRAYSNLRTQAAWDLQRRLDPERHKDDQYPTTTRQPPFHIPPLDGWPLLREDLLALSYDLIGDKTRLIHKKDLLERLGRSPDRGDALIQSFAWE